MKNSEIACQLHEVLIIPGLSSDGILLLFGGLENVLGLRSDLHPEVAEIIQLEAIQFAKEKTDSLKDGEAIGLAWLNGILRDLNIADLTGTFSKDLLLEGCQFISDPLP